MIIPFVYGTRLAGIEGLPLGARMTVFLINAPFLSHSVTRDPYLKGMYGHSFEVWYIPWNVPCVTKCA